MAGEELDRFALVDWERSACLCDVGAPGHSAVVTVASDGRDALWITDDAELHAEHPRCGNGDQPHEQIGALPPDVQARIDQAYTRRNWPRCGRPRKDGQPCRTPVARRGQHCSWHRDSAPKPDQRAAP
ncbi:hypothetical protein [Mycobacteroides abscessus]|uniref:hypothetical protein n=1 Tax=Mycobacteroides abscessus TaxID=36809 RepID=UPI0009296F0B|nr:hypothetical protein [Mycobacteroides abscessus]SIK28976.1 Uncharacterised protein [Mycobacteroides abscessus subsp. abscessus]